MDHDSSYDQTSICIQLASREIRAPNGALIALALTHLHIGVADGSFHSAIPSDLHVTHAVRNRRPCTTQHNTTLIDDFGGLFDNAPTHPLATESGNSVQQEKVVGRKRFEWDWISTVTRPGSRRLKNGQSSVPGEILEKRQLLSDDPITEMNT